MSQIFEVKNSESNELFNRFAIPVRYGLMVGFILMFLTTVTFLYIMKWNFWAFSGAGFMMFLIPVIFYGIAASKQKKEMGGAISLKDAFQTAFVVILISQLISGIYGLIYIKYIDPDCMIRMKETMLEFFESMKNMPQESIDQQMKNMDEQIDGSTKPSILLYSTAKSIIIHSIFGFIAALIVSRKKPVEQH